MKISISVASLIFSFSITLFAQAPDTLWTKTIGGNHYDSGNSVQQTSDGGYIIIGSTRSFSNGSDLDIWLIKTDPNGDTLWTRIFGGISDDSGYSVQQTADGGYILTGTLDNFQFLFLIKTSADGNTQWAKTFGTNGGGASFSVQETFEGGYILTGYTNLGVLLIRTDSNGDMLWTKSFALGGWSIGRSVEQTSDSGYVLVGDKNFSDPTDVWLLKTDTNGDTLWTKAFDGSYYDSGYSVQQTADNGYIIAGSTNLHASEGSDALLLKTDSNGDTLWTKTFGGLKADEAFSVGQTSDGGYILTGYTNSYGSGYFDGWLIKADANGDSLWTKTFGEFNSYDVCYSVQQTSDDGYIISGKTGLYGGDIWLIKLEPDINDENPLPVVSDFQLYQNYPNPFNPTTNIQYTIGSKQFVSLKVFDLIGKEIATLVNEEKPAGSYTVEFDASKRSSGIYFYQLRAGDFTQTKKMILMR